MPATLTGVLGGARRRELARQALGRHLEKVALEDGQVRNGGAPELGDEVAIDFAREHLLRARGQRPGQRAAAGSDFQEDLVARRRDGADDLVNPGGLEKMLTESLAGSMASRSVS